MKTFILNKFRFKQINNFLKSKTNDFPAISLAFPAVIIGVYFIYVSFIKPTTQLLELNSNYYHALIGMSNSVLHLFKTSTGIFSLVILVLSHFIKSTFPRYQKHNITFYEYFISFIYLLHLFLMIILSLLLLFITIDSKSSLLSYIVYLVLMSAVIFIFTVLLSKIQYTFTFLVSKISKMNNSITGLLFTILVGSVSSVVNPDTILLDNKNFPVYLITAIVTILLINYYCNRISNKPILFDIKTNNHNFLQNKKTNIKNIHFLNYLKFQNEIPIQILSVLVMSFIIVIISPKDVHLHSAIISFLVASFIISNGKIQSLDFWFSKWSINGKNKMLMIDFLFHTLIINIIMLIVVFFVSSMFEVETFIALNVTFITVYIIQSLMKLKYNESNESSIIFLLLYGLLSSFISYYF